MQTLTGGSTINILKNALNLVDVRLTNHGDRVAYILKKMLEHQGSYKKEDLDKYLIIAILHDIGAYKTDEIDSMLSFDTNGVWSHSIYGYLYLKYLSPLNDYAEIVLYHHLDYNLFSKIEYDKNEICMYLSIADRIDVMLCNNEGSLHKFDLEKYRDKKFYGKGLNLFFLADKRYGIIRHLHDDSYQKEMKSYINSIYMDEETCKDYLKLLVYSIDFQTEQTAVRTINTNIISVGICKLLHLSEEETKKIYYASLVYDLGMLAIPKSIINAPRTLTKNELKLVHTHLDIMKSVLEGEMDKSVIEIAMGHHEKLDGSGYPLHLKSGQITLLQQILAIADIMSALSSGNSRRMEYNKKDLIQQISSEAANNKLNSDVIQTIIENFDDLMEKANSFTVTALNNYRNICEQYASIIKKFEKYNG